jgi:hypothetical protein
MKITFHTDAGELLMEVVIPDPTATSAVVKSPVTEEEKRRNGHTWGTPAAPPDPKETQTYAWAPMAQTVGMAHLVPCPNDAIREQLGPDVGLLPWQRECPEIGPHQHTADGAVRPLDPDQTRRIIIPGRNPGESALTS